MTRIGRYRPSEISAARISSALWKRGTEIPHDLAWRLSSLASANRARIRAFRDKHRGARCFIVANGPSLVHTDLDLLRNDITFGLNRIYLLFSRSSFRPTYYAAVNELVLEQFSAEIRQLQMPKFINWNRRAYYGTNDPLTLLVKSKLVLRDYFEPDLTRPVVVGGTVTFVALQIAFYMGFKTVVIVGLDHNYSEKGVPSASEVRQAGRDLSHFDPSYFPQGVKWQLPDLLRSEIDFQIAEEAYRTDGREILDATIGGHCPVFRKVSYRTLF